MCRPYDPCYNLGGCSHALRGCTDSEESAATHVKFGNVFVVPQQMLGPPSECDAVIAGAEIKLTHAQMARTILKRAGVDV